MGVPKKYLASLIPEHFYHVYNRTNNKEVLFRTEHNRIFFLQQYRKYLHPFLRTYCYCLLENHFHLFISVRSQIEILTRLKEIDPKQLTMKEREVLINPESDLSVQHFIEWQFLRFFTSYSMTFNHLYNRNGNLFHRPFKRVEVESDHQISQVIFYTHANPVKHRLIGTLQDYGWSSYNSILCDRSTLLEREFIIKWFGNRDKYIEYHNDSNFEFKEKSFYIEES